MHVLLDESVPVDFAHELSGVDVETVRDRGWAGLKNGALLRQAQGQFAVLVTMDKNIRYQQNLTAYAIGVVLMRAVSNRIDDLRPLVPELRETIAAVQLGEIRVVGA